MTGIRTPVEDLALIPIFFKSRHFFIQYFPEVAVCRCSRKKLLLNISQNLQENTCFGVSFLIKLQAGSL